MFTPCLPSVQPEDRFDTYRGACPYASAELCFVSLRHKYQRVGSAAVLSVLVVSACGGGGSTSDSTVPSGDGGIFISGSSTVEPISTAVAKLFGAANPKVAIQIEGPGTGDGFAKFCAGEVDITNASRPIKEAEVEKCAAKGIEFVELRIAVDGLSVVTAASNDLVDCISFADLWVLLGPDAIGRDNWKDANAAAEELRVTLGDEFGLIHAPYPDASLAVTAPGEESGTFDSFVELVTAKVGKKLGAEDVLPRPDYTASPNDNVIIEGIAANPTSLGWVGFAFVEENLDKIKPLHVDAGKGCVEPTPETIAGGEYPVARSLYVYVNADRAKSRPAVGEFVDYYLSDDGMAVIGAGAGQVPFVRLNDADLAETRTAWSTRLLGTHVGD